MEQEEVEVRNNVGTNRFEVQIGEHLAFAQYHVRPGTIVFTHTEVPPQLGGRGIANQIAKAALDHARSERLGVLPLCSFIAGYIRRHPEYQDLITSDVIE